ncbi:hypothetical protein DAPPUDRAFT_238611 [Daphnia pulex]|uniref:Uncharacterized protein n=1 Tax=Daphnia pulex TaxID=6669 RepID=E9G6X7_DAPPU|nr:hypothetical protein DAPPUDRAFT_238611 [Daphnia pulex]|eukprot:EFX84737.1 hypothetical protein DAPPUDRAFT_238611 [Daphnia pulex]
MVNYGVVLLLGVVSLMAGSTAGAAMSPWYGGNQTATPTLSYTTNSTTSSCTDVFQYYTTKAPEFYTTTYAAPSHYTDALNYYTEAPADDSTKTVEYYTEAACTSLPRSTQPQLRRPIPICYTKAALSCYVEQQYYTDALIYFTTTYATPSYNTAAPKYYTEEAAYYTTTYAA